MSARSRSIPRPASFAVVGYVAVDDVGTIVHEMIVDGQTHGGIAQGLGQVLGEQVVYGADGQLINASFMDYVMPRAARHSASATGHHSVPCTTNPIGVKGAGEVRRRGLAAVGDECGPRRAVAARDRSFRHAGIAAADLAGASTAAGGARCQSVIGTPGCLDLLQ